MSTSRGQQIGIWIIAIVMTVGTIGSFFVIILANNNQTKDTATQQKLYADYQAAVAKQAKDLSDKYYSVLTPFSSQVAAYTADDVKTLTTNDLKVGDGATLDAKTSYSAYYIGWNPEGKIFDQSIDGTSLKAPIQGANLIKGWMQGVIGMKIGGVRELSIPADLAYGDTGSGDLIPPHTPIKFVVLAIPTPPTVPVPNFLQSSGVSQ